MSSKANFNAPPTAPPKYLNDFSKALASEVRILLQEVGKLRDERRALQYEIAQLMALKSQHGPGGQFSAGWQPPSIAPSPHDMTPPALPALEAAPFSPSEGPTGPVRGGWRVVHQPRKAERKGKGTKALAIQEAPAPPAPIAPVKPVPSWATWKPNPALTPPPQHQRAVAPPPPIIIPSPPRVQGLFGPQTP